MVTVMSATPAAWAGEVNTQVVVDEHDTELAATVPKVAVVPPLPGSNPVPVTVTAVPPAGGPPPGFTPVTVGAVATFKVNVQVPLLADGSESVPDTVYVPAGVVFGEVTAPVLLTATLGEVDVVT